MSKTAITPFGIGLPIPIQRRTINPIEAMLAPFDFGEMALNDVMHGFKVDIKDNDDSYEVKADLPGAEKGDVGLQIEDDILTITYHAENEASDKVDNGTWITRERTYTSMQRSFALPNADEDKATASLADGVLTVAIPKKEPAQTTKTIEIS